MDNIQISIEIIDKLLVNADRIYQEKLPFLIESRIKLLNEYNIFGVLKHFYFDNMKSNVQLNDIEQKIIHPQQDFFETAIINKLLHQKNFLKRLKYKVMSKFKLISYL